MLKSNEKAAEVIDVAREVLKATGWCRMDLGEWRIDEVGEDGEHCAVGCLAAGASIMGVKPGDPYSPTVGTVYAKAVQAVYESLPRRYALDDLSAKYFIDKRDALLGQQAWSIAAFNDDLGEDDKAKVLALFRRASNKLRAA